MQSSQNVPDNSAHEALATLTRFSSRPFGRAFVLYVRTGLNNGRVSQLPRQININYITDHVGDITL